MKKERLRNKFLKELKRIPIVQIACERCGISRQTAYRWRQEDPRFATEWDEALVVGEALVSDMAESQLLQLIKEGKFPAVRYWLDRRHRKFKRPPNPEPTEQERLHAKYGHLSTDEIKLLLKRQQQEVNRLLNED